MKHFLNHRDSLVQESLDGLIAFSGGRLTRLDGYPHIKVVMRNDWKADQVALISGGGSGHEPAHAGFVGPGMLTAAVCGEVFASPSVEAVLSAIRAVTGEAGALLVVKNYTGDRLNFGLAAERARHLGYKVEVVIVGDDVSLAPSIQPRGLAGTLFVHKIAGYLAQSGASLQEVFEAALQVADRTRTLGLALTTCRPPGHESKEMIPPEQGELGLGIHGEPGVRRIDIDSGAALMAGLVEALEATVQGVSLCALLNNLGAVPPLEMGLLAREFLGTELGRKTELVIGPARLMTSYDMYGFSLSLLPLEGVFREALSAPVPMAAWPGAAPPVSVSPLPLDNQLAPNYSASSNDLVKSKLLAICRALKEARDHLNELDSRLGDGDCGDTFHTAAVALEESLDELPLREGDLLLGAISRVLGRSAGGSSGVLLAIFSGAAGGRFSATGDWVDSLLFGAERMMFHGGAKPGDRTLLDALLPALEALKQGGSMSEAARAAREGAERTGGMAAAGAGRAAYQSEESLLGLIDPGAEAVALCFEALNRS